MEFKVGHLIFAKDAMLRVIGSGEDHIEVIEYRDTATFGGDLITKTYSKINDTWFKWDLEGGKAIKLKKIGVIDPAKVPHAVKDFSHIKNIDTLIIKGTPYKTVDSTSLSPPEHWINTHSLKSRFGEAVLHIQIKDKKSLYDKGAEAQLLTHTGVVTLKESDVWTIVKN
jgi:hypothetical protein